MSYIDEAAREINVKIVWYSAEPAVASHVVRFISERTRPDLRRIQTIALTDGAKITHFQLVPAALGEIRGFTTRFHLFAIDAPLWAVESDANRMLLFRGADGCALLGGPDESAALCRLDAALAALGYCNVPSVFGMQGVSAGEAATRGRALGFPDADSFALDLATGAGVLDAFKAMAKKLLGAVAGNELLGRPTPPPETSPLVVAPVTEALAKSLEETQRDLDPWQRAYHSKAIWVLGSEEARFNPTDIAPGTPAHVVHVIRPLSSDGFSLMTNGFSRHEPAVGARRFELRADTARHGWQVAHALSLLGRLWLERIGSGDVSANAPAFVTSAAQPFYGLQHFALLSAGSVNAEEMPVNILRVVPLASEERREVSNSIPADALGSWIAARASTLLDRWPRALDGA